MVISNLICIFFHLCTMLSLSFTFLKHCLQSYMIHPNYHMHLFSSLQPSITFFFHPPLFSFFVFSHLCQSPSTLRASTMSIWKGRLQPLLNLTSWAGQPQFRVTTILRITCNATVGEGGLELYGGYFCIKKNWHVQLCQTLNPVPFVSNTYKLT